MHGMEQPENRFMKLGDELETIRNNAEKRFELPTAVMKSEQYERFNFLIERLKAGKIINIVRELEKIKFYEVESEVRLSKPLVSTPRRNIATSSTQKKLFPFYPIARVLYGLFFLTEEPYRDYVYLADAQTIAHAGYSSFDTVLTPLINKTFTATNKEDGEYPCLATSPSLVDALRRAGSILVTDKSFKGNPDYVTVAEPINAIYHSITDFHFENTHRLLGELQPAYRYLVKAFIAQSIKDFQTASYCLKMIVKLAPKR